MSYLVLSTLAYAEPPVGPSEGDGPLAIPAGRPLPPPPPPRPGSRSAPSLDAAYVASLERYQDEHLRLRPYDTFSYSSGGYVGWGGWGPGYGWGIGFPTVWVDQDHRVAVYAGSERLDVPDLLQTLREPEREADLRGRIRRNRTWSGIGTAVGVAGVVGSIAGLVGSQTAYDPYVRDLWNLEALGATVAMAGGFVFAGFPGSRAERLQYDPSATFDPGELEDEVDRFNGELAKSLDLSPADVMRLGDE